MHETNMEWIHKDKISYCFVKNVLITYVYLCGANRLIPCWLSTEDLQEAMFLRRLLRTCYLSGSKVTSVLPGSEVISTQFYLKPTVEFLAAEVDCLIGKDLKFRLQDVFNYSYLQV